MLFSNGLLQTAGGRTVKKLTYAIVILCAFVFCARSLYAQEHAHTPNAPEEKRGPSQPGTAMGGMMGQGEMGMMSHEHMEKMGPGGMGMMMMHNPRLAGMMMEMRGEMMRIRGEAMMKEADVLRRYGEKLQKENTAPAAPKTGGK
jgi:hypothetical protein